MASQTKKQKYLEKLRHHLNPALVLSVKNDDVERVKLLLILGADINERTNFTYPLYEACVRGHVEMVQVLIDRGANVNTPGKHWQVDSTPLHIACGHGHTDIARLLLECGAEVNANSGWGTPLNRACEHGYMEIVALLLTAGVDLDACNADGNTALHLACKTGQVGITGLLLAKGANTEVENKHGVTALGYAMALSDADPHREPLIELFRHHHPEQVMEKFCTRGPRI